MVFSNTSTISGRNPIFCVGRFDVVVRSWFVECSTSPGSSVRRNWTVAWTPRGIVVTYNDTFSWGRTTTLAKNGFFRNKTAPCLHPTSQSRDFKASRSIFWISVESPRTSILLRMFGYSWRIRCTPVWRSKIASPTSKLRCAKNGMGLTYHIYLSHLQNLYKSIHNCLLYVIEQKGRMIKNEMHDRGRNIKVQSYFARATPFRLYIVIVCAQSCRAIWLAPKIRVFVCIWLKEHFLLLVSERAPDCK